MVGDTIFEKLQSETWSLPPGPGPSWGIKTFEEYKNKDIVGPRLSTGVSIGREKPPMQTKYTAFHTYLNGPNQENTRLDNVVLPMDSRTFYFKKKDRELYRHMMVELYGADTADKTRIVSQGKEDFPYNPEMMPEAHKEFYNRVQIALNKLEEEYRDKFVPGGRRKWRTFRAKQAVPMASSNTTKLNKGTLQEIKSVKFSIKNNSFHNHLVKLDTAFKGKGPLGRSDQNQLIDLQVMEFLEANILTPYYFNNYFEDTSVPTLFRDAYAKIKGFLFGY